MELEKQKEKLLKELKESGINDKLVLDSIKKIKRELFIPKNIRESAYLNRALPISDNQTISQPYTVARMLELLDIKKGNKILEIGAGSGYNAAIMSVLVGSKGIIYSLELKKNLYIFASENLKKSNIKNVKVIRSDGLFGYLEKAKYDRIIITAGTPKIPKELLIQLKNGGIMVLPLSGLNGEKMTKIVKSVKLKISSHGDYLFVPLKGAIENK